MKDSRKLTKKVGSLPQGTQYTIIGRTSKREMSNFPKKLLREMGERRRGEEPFDKTLSKTLQTVA